MSLLPVVQRSHSLFNGAPLYLQLLSAMPWGHWQTWTALAGSPLPISPDPSFNKSPGLCYLCTHTQCCPSLINSFSGDILGQPCRRPGLVPWWEPGIYSLPCLTWGCQPAWFCGTVLGQWGHHLGCDNNFSWLLHAMNIILQGVAIYSQHCTRSSQSGKDAYTSRCMHIKMCEASDFEIMWLPQISSTQK